jgi:hypothetical protein
LTKGVKVRLEKRVRIRRVAGVEVTRLDVVLVPDSERELEALDGLAELDVPVVARYCLSDGYGLAYLRVRGNRERCALHPNYSPTLAPLDHYPACDSIYSEFNKGLLNATD